MTQPAPVCEGEYYSVPPSDHIARYEWAVQQLASHLLGRWPGTTIVQGPNDRRPRFGVSTGLRVLDVGCGSGYGLEMYRDAGFNAMGVDHNVDALAFCHRRGIEVRLGHYPGDYGFHPPFFGISMFEVIEHNVDGMDLLRRACRDASIVLASVPFNEEEGVNPHHVLHRLTPSSFAWMDPQPAFVRSEACPSSLLLAWWRPE